MRGHCRWTCRYRFRGRRRGWRWQRRLRLLVVLYLHRPRLELHLESVSLSSKYYFDLVDGIASSMSRYYGGISLLWCSQNLSARVASPLPSAARFLRPTPPRLREEERERRSSVTARARAQQPTMHPPGARCGPPARRPTSERGAITATMMLSVASTTHAGRGSYGLIGRL